MKEPGGDEMFRRPAEPQHGPLLPILVSYLFSLSTVMRLADVALLLRRPKLLRAYLKTWRTAFVRTPWDDGSFDKLHDARRRHKSLVELTYGETPVVSAVRALRAAGVTQESAVLDLGCGRGRVLLAARYLGARAVGIELLEAHVDATRPILEAVGADVRLGDAERPPLTDITHVYIAWTCFSAETRARIEQRLLAGSPGLKVIALNHPVTSEGFRDLARLSVLCSWGRVPVTVHELR